MNCERCEGHGIERESIGNVTTMMKVNDRYTDHHEVGYICRNCYKALKYHLSGIRAELGGYP